MNYFGGDCRNGPGYTGSVKYIASTFSTLVRGGGEWQEKSINFVFALLKPWGIHLNVADGKMFWYILQISKHDAVIRLNFDSSLNHLL